MIGIGKKTPQAPTDVLSVSRDGFNVSQLNGYLNSVGLLRLLCTTSSEEEAAPALRNSENPCVQI